MHCHVSLLACNQTYPYGFGVLEVKHRPPKFANNCISINALTKGFPEPWNEIPFTLLVS
jgi:hypothetical protein